MRKKDSDPSQQPSEPDPGSGQVYCDTCGCDGPTGTMEIFDVESNEWRRGVPCWRHNPRAH